MFLNALNKYDDLFEQNYFHRPSKLSKYKVSQFDSLMTCINFLTDQFLFFNQNPQML